MAVSSEQGVVHVENKIGGVNKEGFQNFIKELCQILEKEHEKNGGLPFRMLFDNCPAHNSIEDVIDEFPNVVPRRLPPYSPEMNVIEFMLSP